MAKKVLITGGAGFIAHHLIEVLLEKTDWEIISIDRLDFSGNLNRLHEVVSVLPKSTQKRVTVVYHDLKAELNSQIVNRIGDVNIILHLAAGSHVDRSIEYPMEFVLDNVVGTTNLLNYARNLSNLERFVYFSTDEVFGPAPEGVDYKERDRLTSVLSEQISNKTTLIASLPASTDGTAPTSPQLTALDASITTTKTDLILLNSKFESRTDVSTPK